MRRLKTEGGHKRGHSNMTHWNHTAVVKAETRMERRHEDRRQAQEGLQESTGALLGEEPSEPRLDLCETCGDLHGLGSDDDGDDDLLVVWAAPSLRVGLTWPAS